MVMRSPQSFKIDPEGDLLLELDQMYRQLRADIKRCDFFDDDQNMVITGDAHVDMLRQTGTWHAYGGFQDEAETISLDADTWTHVTNATNDLWVGTEADGFSLVDDEMIVENAGDYSGSLSITLTGGNSKDFLFRIYNVTQSAVMGYHVGVSTTVSNYSNVVLPLYLECDANDVLQVQAWCLAGDDPTLRSSIFYMSYLHD